MIQFVSFFIIYSSRRIPDFRIQVLRCFHTGLALGALPLWGSSQSSLTPELNHTQVCDLLLCATQPRLLIYRHDPACHLVIHQWQVTLVQFYKYHHQSGKHQASLIAPLGKHCQGPRSKHFKNLKPVIQSFFTSESGRFGGSKTSKVH